MACGIVTADGQLIEARETPTRSGPQRGPAAAKKLFDSLAQLLDSFAPFDRFDACGIGCGGPMSGGGQLVSPLNIPAWRSFPLVDEVGRVTGLPVFIDNDAKALARAEGWVGGAVGVSNYLAMVVSTGVGGGIVLDGKLLDGLDGNAGHIGHVVVDPDGQELPDHVRGVLEGEASGTAIAYRTGKSAAEADAAEIAKVGRLVGQAVGSVANLLDLKLALIGGSVALGYGEPFFTAVQDEVDRICQLDYSRGAVVRPVGCGADGPLIGAAAVAKFARQT